MRNYLGVLHSLLTYAEKRDWIASKLQSDEGPARRRRRSSPGPASTQMTTRTRRRRLVAEWLSLEQEHFAAYLAGALTFHEQRRARLAGLLAFLGVRLCHGTTGSAVPDILRALKGARRPYDDAVPALDDLAQAGVSVNVLTNGQDAQQRAKLQAVGLLARFDCVMASSTLPAAKPVAEAFIAACERVGRSPHEVYYVGDDLRTDALAATQARVRGVWLNRRAERPEQHPGQTVASLSEVSALVLARAP